MRQYKTASGVYSENDLAVVVWVNPKHKESKQARFLETMTSENSTFPIAFPLRELTTHRSWRTAILAHSQEEVFASLHESRRSKPLLVPLSIATQAFGWENFYIPTEYTTPK